MQKRVHLHFELLFWRVARLALISSIVRSKITSMASMKQFSSVAPYFPLAVPSRLSALRMIVSGSSRTKSGLINNYQLVLVCYKVHDGDSLLEKEIPHSHLAIQQQPPATSA